MLLKRKISKSMLILLFFAFRTFENIQYQHDVFLLILNCVRIFKAIFNSKVLFKNMTWLAQKQAWYSKKYQTMSKMRLGLVIFLTTQLLKGKPGHFYDMVQNRQNNLNLNSRSQESKSSNLIGYVFAQFHVFSLFVFKNSLT